jgi:hypothetical protein
MAKHRSDRKRLYVPASKPMPFESPHQVDWEKVRADWECNPSVTLRGLAKKWNLPAGTVRRRSFEHKWSKFVPVVKRATSSITAAADLAIKRTCDAVAARIEARTVETLKDLEPWIEEQRAVHVKAIVGLSRKGLARLESLYDKAKPKQAKDEQFAAAAMEKHDQIIRRNLGMGDNGTGSTSLNVAVLVGGGRKVIGPDGPDSAKLAQLAQPDSPAPPTPPEAEIMEPGG